MKNGFLVQALIYLGASVLMVPISKKLGLGSVLGYLLAGILIGPSLLHLVGDSGEDIMEFAEFGVVMMLFLAGLEMDPLTLWKWRINILGLGGLQVVITTFFIAFVCHVFIGLSMSISFTLGMCFSMSSTAIAMQSMTENKWKSTKAGKQAFSVLLFQDIAVIPILAIIPLLGGDATVANGAQHKSELIQLLPKWGQTLSVFVAVALIIFAGRYLINPFLKMIARTNLRELFTASALLVVIGISVLMEMVGLSPALGAFLAGVLLANSEFKHELESDVEPFKGLLLGLFFITVGASIDFKLLAAKPVLIGLIVLEVMIAKLLILGLLGRIFKLRRDQAWLFAFTLCQIGEFAFVLISFASSVRIFSAEESQIFMAVTAASMALSPVLAIVFEKVIAPKLLVESTEEKRQPDIIEEENPVIIAGYGRFGSTTGRFLKSNGIKITVLDANSDRVETLRELGVQVYFGDALRVELLKSAGADSAKVIVIALDSASKNLQLVKLVKMHFPQLHILVRAQGSDDAFELMDEGVLHVYRETLDTSLRSGIDAMRILGFRNYTANKAANLFFTHDETALKLLAAARHDRKNLIKAMQSRNEELEELMKKDIHNRNLRIHTGWDILNDSKKKDETSPDAEKANV